MHVPTLFGILGGLLVLAFLANRLSQRTHVPDVVVLMGTGLLIGPVLHWVRAEQFQDVTNAFGTLALILIMFGGGLELNISETLRHFPGGLVFGILVYVMTSALIGLIVKFSLDLPLATAMLVGAVLGCTSSTVVLPVLEQWRIGQPAKVILIVEAALGDILGVLTVGFLLELGPSSEGIFSGLLTSLISNVTISMLAAVGLGFLWSRLLPKLSEQRFWQVLTLSVVLLLYAGTEALHASGLLAVLGFGLALANLPGRKDELRQAMWGAFWPKEPHLKIHEFHAELAFLVRTFFFVLIGIVVELQGLEAIWPLVLGVLGAIFLARFVAVQASRGAWHDMGPAEREVAIWVLPRGLITVVLALQVAAARGDDMAFLPPLAFATILLTNIVVVLGSLRLHRRGLLPVQEEEGSAAPDAEAAP